MNIKNICYPYQQFTTLIFNDRLVYLPMHVITPEPIFHYKTERILLRYHYSIQINNLVRTLPGVRWSQTYKAWHIPMNDAAYKAALSLLLPLCTIDDKALKQWLEKRTLVQGIQINEMPAGITPKQAAVYGKISSANLADWKRWYCF